MISTQFRLTLRAPNDCTETEGHTHCAATLVSKAAGKATFSVYCTMCGKVHTVTRRIPDTEVTRPVRGSWKTELPAALTVGKVAHVLNEGVETGYKMFIPDGTDLNNFKLGSIALDVFWKKNKKGEATSTLQVDGKIPASWLIDISAVTDESEPAEAWQELAFA